jgi:hypothetical protein
VSLSKDDFSDQEIERLSTVGAMPECRSAMTILIDTKKKIEMQLLDGKAQMTSVRSKLISEGRDPRMAQMEATSSVDPQWRSRAIRVIQIKDKQIRKIKTRIASLSGDPVTMNGKVMQKRSAVPFPFANRTMGDVCAEIQAYLDDGWSAFGSIQHPEGAIVIFRKDSAS